LCAFKRTLVVPQTQFRVGPRTQSRVVPRGTYEKKNTTRVPIQALQNTDAPVPILGTRDTTRDPFW
jgi:hypothetical protein